ncbi:hypothetical protein KKF34_09875 [Myxococcota bacterium]|nr:hypothetical protein [Myxococcota bacterium]MBU1379671.1 hypothetical protein [Myxococcota bacterium]MBU1497173.1 hypothetical protein [Myxococcota bacterium]
MQIKPAFILLITAITMLSCDSDFPEMGELGDDMRIMAVNAEPPCVAMGETTVITPLIWTHAKAANRLWFACLPDAADKEENLDRCMRENYASQNGVIPDCTQDPESRLCFISGDETATYTVPSNSWFAASSEASATEYFYIMLIASPALDVFEHCENTIRTMAPTSECLIAGKRVLFSSHPLSNDNPVITGLETPLAASDATEILHLSSGKTKIRPVFDPETIDELASAGSMALEISYYTSCGTIDPWFDSIECTSSGNSFIQCDVPWAELKTEKVGDCMVYAILRDREFYGEWGDIYEGIDPWVPGVNWLEKPITVE